MPPEVRRLDAKHEGSDWPVREETACFGCIGVRKVGNIYILAQWTRSDGKKQRLVLGPYWHFLLITLGIMVSVCVMVYGFVVPTDCKAERIIGLALAVLSISSLMCTAVNDPGVFPRYSKPLAPNWTFSEYAQCYRPPGVIFCQQCQVLIEDYNHFCPWSGIVIGKGNDAYFQVFIISIVASFVYDLVVILLSLYDMCF
mmetsp:Transcript_4205/g.12869  ORF Transcript_4205/g.12869 Transcript_4205/m.12869 type:complete len:199 (+) Transcript_4205:50-646(+)